MIYLMIIYWLLAGSVVGGIFYLETDVKKFSTENAKFAFSVILGVFWLPVVLIYLCRLCFKLTSALKECISDLISGIRDLYRMRFPNKIIIPKAKVIRK